MILQAKQKPIAVFFLAIFIISQIFLVGSYALIPKQAKAFLGFGDLVIKVGDVYDILKDIALAALRQVAINYANKFLTKFVDKLQDKYKIRNYLYYDRVLTDYYLNRYISDRITDPDLRGIYTLLERGFVSGAPTGTTGGPDPRAALIPRLNAAINKYYQKQGGIDPNKIYNPSPNVSDREYFATAQAYFSNPPSFTEQNLRGQFGAFQSAATTASQLEVLVGNGLKAGRIVGGYCKLREIGYGLTVTNGIPGPLPGTPVPVPGVPPPPPPASGTTNFTPQTCQQAGGVWQDSALDQARSFINNPTQFTASWMDAAIQKITGNNFDPNNYKAVIGSFLGNFLFNQLNLDRNSNDTLPDSPFQYTAEAADNPNGVPIDFDADGLPDGYDINNDGSPDICIYGGAAGGAGPPCLGSVEATSTTPSEGPTCITSPNWISCRSAAQTGLVQQVKNYVTAAGIYQTGTYCMSFEIVKRVAWALRDQGVGVLATFHTSQCNGFSADVIAYSDNSGVDILGAAPEEDRPIWLAGPPNNEAGVFWVAPSDPGDPADACYFTRTCLP